MSGKGLSMREILEVKRLLELNFSNRRIATTLGIHRNTINKYVEEIKSDNLKINSEKANFTKPVTEENFWVHQIHWEDIKNEYLKGVSLQVIHEELFASGKVPVLYSGFWKQLKKNINLSRVTMVRVFKPGERCEIDYCDGIDILDPVSGEIKTTELFVGVLCQSRYAFAEFTWSQKSSDFLGSHVNMFKYFSGTPQVVSPDNLKSAVTKAHRYDPEVNPAYTRLAAHYGIAVVPARVKTPQDKAIVERTIQIFQRWFYSLVRNKTFTSLFELNKSLKFYLEIFNNKIHRIFKRSRKEMFVEEQKSLQVLPLNDFEVASYKKAKLSRDCHLILESNFYSAPYYLREKELDIWYSSKTVEIFFESQRVAVHKKVTGEGKFCTDVSHYPETHKAYAEEDIQALIEKSKCIGVNTENLIYKLLNSPTPYKYFRRSQGIIALSWKYSKILLEEACEAGLRFNNTSPRYLEGVIRMRKGVRRKEEDPIKRQKNEYLRGVNNIH